MANRVVGVSEAIALLTRMVEEQDMDSLACMVSELCDMHGERVIVASGDIESDVYCNGYLCDFPPKKARTRKCKSK
jgi:hypothetical protein